MKPASLDKVVIVSMWKRDVSELAIIFGCGVFVALREDLDREELGPVVLMLGPRESA